jgi:hypothetical protein
MLPATVLLLPGTTVWPVQPGVFGPVAAMSGLCAQPLSAIHANSWAIGRIDRDNRVMVGQSCGSYQEIWDVENLRARQKHCFTPAVTTEMRTPCGRFDWLTARPGPVRTFRPTDPGAPDRPCSRLCQVITIGSSLKGDGYLAAEAGQSLSEDPHPRGTIRQAEWRSGWQTKRSEGQRALRLGRDVGDGGDPPTQ